MELSITNSQRKTQAQKDANDFQWYKDQANLLSSGAKSSMYSLGYQGVSDFKRMKVNYDLFNNIINLLDFEYVCKPFGAEGGELPANFTNRDILSNKIKVLLGMEMTMPFSWKVVAVNEEATTRIEQETFKKIREYVEAQIMQPIKTQLELMELQKTKGRQLTPQEQQDTERRIQQELEKQTPDEVRRYMARDHQDPAEVLGNQLLEFLIWKTNAKDKFNDGWKHSNLSGKEIYWVGEVNGNPDFEVINPLYFKRNKSIDTKYIENGEWAIYERRMTPSQVIATFGSQLKSADIDRIYNYFKTNPSSIIDPEFRFSEYGESHEYTLSVIHHNWISLRKIGFLYDEEGNSSIVDELYKLNPEAGDVKIEWEWIPEAHEVYRILDDIFVYPRPVPGQYVDLENLYNAHLSYYGAECDSLNSPTTSPMDRGKTYQYFYNIIIYRMELLMASDEGKKFFINMNAIPNTGGLDLNKFLYFLKANNIGFLNPNEEGNRGSGDVTNMVKEVDMSLISDISKYMQIAEYIERKCGDAVGVTKQMEGAIGSTEAVTNTKQNLMQSAHVIRPYFELHNNVKARVLSGLLEVAKVTYSNKPNSKLAYVLDDMSLAMLTIDKELLDNSTYGMFVMNSAKSADAKMAVEQLAQAALQNQTADIADIIKIIRSDSLTEAEELLEAASSRKAIQANEIEMSKIQQLKEQQQAIANEAQLERDHEAKMIVLKEGERRKTEIQKQTILSLGFNENKDEDSDGVPDVLEVAKFGVEADIKRRKLALDERKQAHQEQFDAEKLKLDKKKLTQQNNKPKNN